MRRRLAPYAEVRHDVIVDSDAADVGRGHSVVDWSAPDLSGSVQPGRCEGLGAWLDGRADPVRSVAACYGSVPYVCGAEAGHFDSRVLRGRRGPWRFRCDRVRRRHGCGRHRASATAGDGRRNHRRDE